MGFPPKFLGSIMTILYSFSSNKLTHFSTASKDVSLSLLPPKLFIFITFISFVLSTRQRKTTFFLIKNFYKLRINK